MGIAELSNLLPAAVKSIWTRRLPGQVIIQITDRCNARCPNCGMRVSSAFPRTGLSMDTIRRVLDAAAANRVAAVSFTGGEPLLRLDDLAEMISHAGAVGIPFIRTGTNGFFMRPGAGGRERDTARVSAVAEKLAATPLRNFWISVDSCDPETHDRMRGFPGLMSGIEAALPVFHEHGIFPAANLGVNRNLGGDFTAGLEPRDFIRRSDYLEEFYRRYTVGLQRFYHRVIDMGFTMLNTCYPMSVENGSPGNLAAVYAATAADRIVSFDRDEKELLFRILMETVREFRSRIRVFSPLTSLYALYRHYAGEETTAMTPAGCRGGRDFFFIDAREGDTYPCGYRGHENLGKYWGMNPDRFSGKSECRRCDWECFRDPSEQFSALTGFRRFSGNLLHDKTYRHCWFSDMAYYRTCDFFDGRQPPGAEKLSRWRRLNLSLFPTEASGPGAAPGRITRFSEQDLFDP
ncbi:MAG: radical SAM protein [Thermodesulfobacteriota bacterium]